MVAPQIVQPPVNGNVCIGGSATFFVAATGVTPLYYQWLKDGEPIPSDHEATLVLNSVSATDAGEYAVRVSNACGAIVSQPVTLSVFVTGGADIDRNGIVDGADIRPFVIALLDGPPPLPQWCAADMDGDGDVDLTDMSLFIAALLGA